MGMTQLSYLEALCIFVYVQICVQEVVWINKFGRNGAKGDRYETDDEVGRI